MYGCERKWCGPFSTNTGWLLVFRVILLWLRENIREYHTSKLSASLLFCIKLICTHRETHIEMKSRVRVVAIHSNSWDAINFVLSLINSYFIYIIIYLRIDDRIKKKYHINIISFLCICRQSIAMIFIEGDRNHKTKRALNFMAIWLNGLWQCIFVSLSLWYSPLPIYLSSVIHYIIWCSPFFHYNNKYTYEYKSSSHKMYMHGIYFKKGSIEYKQKVEWCPDYGTNEKVLSFLFNFFLLTIFNAFVGFATHKFQCFESQTVAVEWQISIH